MLASRRRHWLKNILCEKRHTVRPLARGDLAAFAGTASNALKHASLGRAEDFVQKLDATLLRHQSSNIGRSRGRGGSRPPPSRVRVLMRITGAAKHRRAGVYRTVRTPVVADRRSRRSDNIAALRQSVRIEAEQFRQLQLNDSVPEIHANQVWTATPGYTGNGVVVGIIDTGIDIFHHCFRNAGWNHPHSLDLGSIADPDRRRETAARKRPRL